MVDAFRRLLVAGLALGLMAGNAKEFTKIYDETTAHARHLATTADLRTIGAMLDYQLMRTGRYPDRARFAQWMQVTFKESPNKPLGLDHWGNALVYATDAERKTYELRSSGPDGALLTPDDLNISGP